ncbi:electron transfer flavoprotein subunit alpha/FixB family protein [candidate division KSB1 bacterium]|nr:MAG: electron transfer flavoprotein subunit alpha/FixB family protein [candidate division KSB1 bacterium]
MEGPVVIFAETRNGKLRNVSFEVATAGKKIANNLGKELIAIIIENNENTLSHSLGIYGVDKIINARNPLLESYSTDGYAKTLSEIVEKINPSLILMSASAMGRDLAPRLAARLNVELISDCVKLDLNNGNIEVKRPIFAGKAFITIRSNSRIKFITLRPKVFTAEIFDENKKAELEEYNIDFSGYKFKSKVKEILQEKEGKVDLTEADIIVSGGRGMKGPDNYKIIEELADVLNGVVGASRAAVDAGWRPHSDQVGQTGKVVSPTLYIACGISGAIQHLAGMSSSKWIVAINKDPEAPIFKVANYGIVGDLFEVVPALTEELKNIMKD